MKELLAVLEKFTKEPVAGLLFFTIICIGYLYLDNKTNYQHQIEVCGTKVDILEKKVDLLEDRLKVSDSLLVRALVKLESINAQQ